MPSNPRSFLELYPEFILSPEEKEAFLKDRKGFMAGRKLATRFGWKVGDIGDPERNHLFRRIGISCFGAIYRGRDENTDETQFIFHWDYLNETLKKRSPRIHGLIRWAII